MQDKDIKYLIALSHFPKFGPVRIKKIKKFFPDYKTAYNAKTIDLQKAGIEEKIAKEFISFKDSVNPSLLIEKLKNENIKVLTLEDRKYSKLLSEIYDPPPLLYYKGEFKKNDEFTIGVVGTRKFSSYGQRVVEAIVKDLAINNITIVSGLALGIDSLAHNATLDAGGRTIAVLGTGIDKQSIYPSSNRYLADKIISSGGVVLSEFPLGTPPLRHHFPQRNRIISGLSVGVLVIEAGEKSGALITARHALDQNREVFAIPGNIYSSVSIGPNNLIKEGAKAIASAKEILETLDLSLITSYINNKKILPETREEELLLEHISSDPLHVDELIRLTNLNVSAINSTLTLMEMKGMIRNLGNMQYVLAR
ncbi:DNA-protecting protein DprA [Candidatus Falkowbacteria bacterium]|nr:MAG: DNA-protecting protein DprA [Candidatus Falkowbacteria bacterium]